jgi:hypothetical protein
MLTTAEVKRETAIAWHVDVDADFLEKITEITVEVTEINIIPVEILPGVGALTTVVLVLTITALVVATLAIPSIGIIILVPVAPTTMISIAPCAFGKPELAKIQLRPTIWERCYDLVNIFLKAIDVVGDIILGVYPALRIITLARENRKVHINTDRESFVDFLNIISEPTEVVKEVLRPVWNAIVSIPD